MSIVLAIEPDHRQAAHLTAIVRHQVGADLVLAHTTEGALDAIGNRVRRQACNPLAGRAIVPTAEKLWLVGKALWQTAKSALGARTHCAA